jgi:hypothetical protein
LKVLKTGLILSALSFGLIACSSQVEDTSSDENKNVEQIEQKGIKEKVWDQLSETDKDRIDGSWEDAEIHKVVLKESMLAFKLEGKKHPFIGDEVFALDFPTNESSISNMIVYAEPQSFKYIGHGLTD